MPLPTPYKVLVLLLLLHVAVSAQNRSAPVKADLPATEIAKRILPSVAIIVCDDGKDTFQGSGFFVAPGIIVTNYHVIAGKLRGFVRPAQADPKKWFRISAILKIDATNDLALIGVPDLMESTQPLRLFDGDMLAGETVFALGNPEGLSGSISTGIVSAAKRKIKGKPLIQISAPISHGSSGGPIVNTKGEVAGVAVGSITEGQNLNFAIPAPLVKLLLFGWEIEDNAKLWKYLEPEKPALKNAWAWLDTIPVSERVDGPPPAAPVIGPRRPGETEAQASLRKVEGVYVVVEPFDSDLQRYATENFIKTWVEMTLRRYGIRVLTKQEWFSASGAPMLYLNINSLLASTGDMFALSYHLEFSQNVLLERDPSFTINTTTWSSSSVALVGLNKMSESLKKSTEKLTEQFCSNYALANR